ncbi:MAG: endolytic transglycosylase MltG [Asticcacaulis sp.]
MFINRLRQGIRLGSDPTVIYGISHGEPLGRGLTKAELDAYTPWNTYQIDKLPITPISNPGKASLEAVLHPATPTISISSPMAPAAASLPPPMRSTWPMWRTGARSRATLSTMSPRPIPPKTPASTPPIRCSRSRNPTHSLPKRRPRACD